MIERTITKKLSEMLEKFPVALLTGPRQSGKSTLLRNAFPTCDYVSLEEPDIRLLAQNDPRGFLNNYRNNSLKRQLDAVKYTPFWFRFVRLRVLKRKDAVLFIGVLEDILPFRI
jgi:predicted AAA+ superfamily ATPase